MSKGCVLVIGDAMLDEHVYGESERLSPEAPVPVVRIQKREWALGAAANVAAHITAGGVDCLFSYKSGWVEEKDDSWRHFGRLCSDKNVRQRPLAFEQGVECPVITKTRIWSGSQQVVRIDDEHVSPPGRERESEWIEDIRAAILEYPVRVVVFSDYNKGTLTDRLIDEVSETCSKASIPTILDPKRPSFFNLKNVDIIKPNVREVAITNLTAKECSQQLGRFTFLVNTLGSEGMRVYQDGKVTFECPTVAQEVIDVCGCGDTVTALMALSLFENHDIQQAVEAANKGASFTITHKGCYVLTSEEIRECLA